MLTEIQQQEILTTIASATRGRGKTNARDRHLLLVGVITALRTVGYTPPPAWQINVLCGRTDRIFKEAGL